MIQISKNTFFLFMFIITVLLGNFLSKVSESLLKWLKFSPETSKAIDAILLILYLAGVLGLYHLLSRFLKKRSYLE